MAIPEEVVSLGGGTYNRAGPFVLGLKGGDTVKAHTIVIASGAQYRRPQQAAHLIGTERRKRGIHGVTPNASLQSPTRCR